MIRRVSKPSVFWGYRGRHISQNIQRISVVSGGSRGIGLEFVKQLLAEDETGHVVVLSRTNSNSSFQHLLRQYHSRIHWISTDLTSPEAINVAINQICTKYNQLNLLINCAGILGNNTVESPGPERTISSIEPNWLSTSMQVNLFSHVLITKGLTPLLRETRKRDNQAIPIPLVVNLSARVGSISDNKYVH
jgi:NAD(P)-dependent dehydrogenase (short-subunit alcohol dehydrogenase family)